MPTIEEIKCALEELNNTQSADSTVVQINKVTAQVSREILAMLERKLDNKAVSASKPLPLPLEKLKIMTFTPVFLAASGKRCWVQCTSWVIHGGVINFRVQEFGTAATWDYLDTAYGSGWIVFESRPKSIFKFPE